jgi:hypothetical protein
MLKRRAPNGISAFSGSHWSASSTAEWMTGSLEHLPQIVLTGDRWNARARREEKQHGFLWAPPIPGPRLARAGAPVCPCIRTETLSNFITTVSTCQRLARKAATAIRNNH